MNASQSHGLSEKRLDSLIGTLLRGGVILAATVVVAGGAFYLAKYGALKPDYRIFRGEATDLRSVSGIFHDAISWHARGLIQFGLLLLIATPLARVAFCVVAFASERDWLYVTTTLIVFGVLIYSLASA
jgi:uncharacterized membrane protein